MAVTQLLARVPPDLLRQCRGDVAALERVVSFAGVPRNFYLDLDWAPAPLLELMRAARQPRAHQEALRHACDGVRAVNMAFPEGAVWVAPRELDVAEVVASSLGIGAIDADALFAVGGSLASGDTANLRPHFNALRGFYAAAASAEQGVIVWWD